MSTTAARVFESDSAHWYSQSGEAVHTVARADGEGYRPTTLRDARVHNYLPSVSSILRVLAKPALESWKSEQIALAIATAPRIVGEEIDVFIRRVLQKEQQQHEERDAAAKKGTAIHRLMEQLFNGTADANDPLMPYVRPAYEAMMLDCAEVIATEKVLVGDGYAGTTDLICKSKESGKFQVWDFKSTKRIPEQPYPENKLQLSAYAAAFLANSAHDPHMVEVGNVFISSTNPGEYAILEHEEWAPTFTNGFLPALKLWKWMNNF